MCLTLKCLSWLATTWLRWLLAGALVGLSVTVAAQPGEAAAVKAKPTRHQPPVVQKLPSKSPPKKPLKPTTKTASKTAQAPASGHKALATAKKPNVASTPASDKQAVVEKQAGLNKLRRQIDQLKKEVAGRQIERGEVSDQLKSTEKRIDQLEKQLQSLSEERTAVDTALTALGQQLGELEGRIHNEQTTLAKQLRWQYQQGQTDVLRRLLTGVNPHQAERDAYYARVLAEQRQNLLASLDQALTEKRNLQQKTSEQQAHLSAVNKQQMEIQRNLSAERNKRLQTLKGINLTIEQRQQQIVELQQDERRLSLVIERINHAIAARALAEKKQRLEREAALRRAEGIRKAEAEARQRREQEARQRSEAIAQQRRVAEAARQRAASESAQRRAAEEEARRLSSAQERLRAEREAQLRRQSEHEAERAAQQERQQLARLEIERRRAEAEAAAQSAEAKARIGKVEADIPHEEPQDTFVQRRGGMPLPTQGRIAGRFGQPREGGVWKGIFIRADEGAAVQAVSAGLVVLAERMRGYGNLLIIDHGGGYLTVYANNEAIVKKVGDRVRGGEVIARVGNSGGNPDFGLYFEVRRRNTAIDPLPWLGRRG